MMKIEMSELRDTGGRPQGVRWRIVNEQAVLAWGTAGVGEGEVAWAHADAAKAMAKCRRRNLR